MWRLFLGAFLHGVCIALDVECWSAAIGDENSKERRDAMRRYLSTFGVCLLSI
jgi:hypothetical protein